MVEEENNEKEESLKDLMKKNNKILEEMMKKGEPTKFKFPFKAKLSKVNIKKNFVTVIIVHENRNLEFMKLPVQNGVIFLDNIHRLATTDYTLYYKGKPVIIIPAWSLKPFSPEENYEKTVQEKMHTAGRKLLFERMKLDVIKPKGMGFGIIGWIILFLILAGVAYYFFKGGKLF